MSSDIDLPLTLRHDQVSANAAHPSVPGNVYSHVHVAAGGRSHLGNSYNIGPTEDQQILQSILQSLHYPEMGQRGSDVPEAGTDTFEWLFEDGGRRLFHDSEESDEDEQEYVNDERQSDEGEAHDQEGWEEMILWELSHVESTCSEDQYERGERGEIAAKLRSWLKDDGDNVFWVTGKPGSGKSTFMKFLRDHDGTDILLREWAGDDLLIVADHFFWLPGTQLQKSFEGLARSLMHAILSSLAADITSAKAVCAKRRWSLNTSHRPWSQSEFKRMFSSLGGLRGIRVFLLIDGLDECCPQQKHDDLMNDLVDIVRLPNFKACLSSRPWKEFATRLERSPSLCLEWITRRDMISYVSNRIHQATQERDMTAAAARKLVNLVVHRADGVFLWVELVVRAVKVELKKDRGLVRVYSIVEDLPSELDDYFTTLIYNRIEKTSGNISDTASVLSLAIQMKDRDIDLLHSTHLHAFIDFWLLSRGALDPLMDCPDIDAPKFDKHQVDVMLEQTRSFLELASKDLLVLEHGGVEFLHRTVADFLMNGSVNEAIRRRSPTHFQQPDFLPHVQMLRCVHVLMMTDVTCDEVDTIVNLVVRYPRADVVTWTKFNAITTACESLAIDHLQNSEHCLGKGGRSHFMHEQSHSVRIFSSIPTDLGVDPIPYRYVRTLFRHWPQIAHTNRMIPLHTSSRAKSTSISRMRLRYLCVLCTNIVHDCLYSGVVPTDWIAPRKPVSRKKFNPVKVSKPSVRSDDGLQCYHCEFCGVYLPSSKDNGLRDAFLLFEKIAFESLFPNAGVLAQIQSASPASEKQIIKVLPSELPWSILRRVDGLQTLRANLRFRQFVWCRQNLRAVRSLLTTMRRQFSNLAKARPDGHLTFKTPVNRMQAVWLNFLGSFITTPAWRADSRANKDQCGGCSAYPKRHPKSMIVNLRCDDLLMYCEGCYDQAAQRTLGPSCVLSIQLEPEVFAQFVEEDGHVNSMPINRGIVKSVSKLIAWYSDTAPAFGLGYLIPSDTAEIQRKLLLVPESTV
jgi:hypothetical protein